MGVYGGISKGYMGYKPGVGWRCLKEAHTPGGRGACGEPRGAWCRRLGRRGEAFRGRVRELGKRQHSPKLTSTRIAFIVSLRLHRRKTTRNRRGA